MNRRQRWIATLFTAGIVSVAQAHGGAYQPPPPPPPPSGSVPPGTRIGGPTTGGGSPQGPTTGGGSPSGPTTGGRPGGSDIGGGPTTGGGGPGKGPETGGASGGGPGNPGPGTGGGAPGGAPGTGPGAAPQGGRAVGPTNSPNGRNNAGGLALDHWTRWWYANRTSLIDWSTRVRNRGTTTPSGAEAESVDEMWRAEAQVALLRALNHDNEDIASAAAIAIGKRGDAADSEALLKVMRDRSRQQPVREAAALALGLLGPSTNETGAQARDALADLSGMSRESNRLRAMAIYALGLRGEAASLPILLETANSGDSTWDVPAAAVTALGLGGYEMTRGDLVEMLNGPNRRRNKESVRRAYAAQALALAGATETLPALRKAMRDGDEDVRRGAVTALGSLAEADDDETFDVLVYALKRDKDGMVRQLAAISLGRMGHERAGIPLNKAYEKGDGSMQHYAALGLGLFARNTGEMRFMPALIRDLDKRANADLRGSLAISIGLSGNQAGVEVLREIADDRSHPELRAHCALALGLLEDRDDGAPILRDMVENVNDPIVKREAALGLGMMGDIEALTLLRGLVEDGNSVYEQGSAAVALGHIGGREAGRVLLELLEDEDRPELARSMGAVGLGLLLDPTEGRRLSAVGADLNWFVYTTAVSEILTIL